MTTFIVLYLICTLICGFAFFFMMRNWAYYWNIFKEFMLNAAICLAVGLCWPILLVAIAIEFPRHYRKWKDG